MIIKSILGSMVVLLFGKQKCWNYLARGYDIFYINYLGREYSGGYLPTYLPYNLWSDQKAQSIGKGEYLQESFITIMYAIIFFSKVPPALRTMSLNEREVEDDLKDIWILAAPIWGLKRDSGRVPNLHDVMSKNARYSRGFEN